MFISGGKGEEQFAFFVSRPTAVTNMTEYLVPNIGHFDNAHFPTTFHHTRQQTNRYSYCTYMQLLCSLFDTSSLQHYTRQNIA